MCDKRKEEGGYNARKLLCLPFDAMTYHLDDLDVKLLDATRLPEHPSMRSATSSATRPHDTKQQPSLIIDKQYAVTNAPGA